MYKSALGFGAISLCAFTSPAGAALQLAIEANGATFTCVDNDPTCDSSPTSGLLQLKTEDVGGVVITGKYLQSATNPDMISVSSSSILNTNASTVGYKAVFSDTSFTSPTTKVYWSGSGTFLGPASVGTTFTDNYYADAGNAQGGGTALATPGTPVGTWGGTVSLPSQGFADSGFFPFTATGPFSMTMEWDSRLTAGADVVSRGQAMYVPISGVIPEPATWAMMGLGFALMGVVGLRAKRQAVALD